MTGAEAKAALAEACAGLTITTRELFIRLKARGELVDLAADDEREGEED